MGRTGNNMKRFVWVTRGMSESDMVVAKAVLVYAEDLNEAKNKVLADMDLESDDDKDSIMESYGNEWFVQEVGSEEIN